MTTVTIELSEETERLLAEQAKCRGISVAALVAERLERMAAETEEVLRILRKAQENSAMEEDDAMALALDEVHKVRMGL